MTDHPDATAVSDVPCLARFTPDEAAAAAEQLTELTLAPGETLFRQDETSDSIYVLVSGEAEVRSRYGDAEHEIATLAPGTLIGEFALLLDEHRTRSVVARTDAVLWELTRTAFEAGLAAAAPWATTFLMAVARDLAREMLAVDRQLVALLDEVRRHDDAPPEHVRELEKLRRQLSGEWTF